MTHPPTYPPTCIFHFRGHHDGFKLGPHMPCRDASPCRVFQHVPWPEHKFRIVGLNGRQPETSSSVYQLVDGVPLLGDFTWVAAN